MKIIVKTPVKTLLLLCLIISVTACGGSSNGFDNQKAVKLAPLAVAAIDFSADENTTQTLDGSASYDSDGSIIGHQWVQTSGSHTVTLTNSDQSIATFTTPDIESDTDLTFELTVTDNDGIKSTDLITVTIVRVNNLPIAIVPADINSKGNDLISLDGSTSNDPDGSIVRHDWTQLSGTPAVTINNAHQPTATFTTPNVNAEFSFQLMVTDNEGATDKKIVRVTNQQLSLNKPPIAAVDSVVNTKGYYTVILNGSSSTDPDGTIVTYDWTQISGSPTVAINKSNKAINSFLAPNVTTKLIFQLKVTDNGGASSTDIIEVNIQKDTTSGNQAPTAIITRNTNVSEQAIHILDGRVSYDIDGSIVRYEWIQISGVGISLSSANQAVASYVSPDVSADTPLGFMLTVTDNQGATHSATISVLVIDGASSQKPTAVTDTNFSAYANQSIALNGNESSDADGSVVSYSWTQIAGSPEVAISSPTTADASFMAPDITASTVLTFELLVMDNDGLTDSSNLRITILPEDDTGSGGSGGGSGGGGSGGSGGSGSGGSGGSGNTFYVSDCGAYADPDCVTGNDNNDGLTQATAWRSYARAHNQWSQLNANGTIMLARGGSFDVTGNVRWSNSNSSASNPVTLTDYQPSWGSGNESRPVITQSNNAHVFELNPGYGIGTQAGFTFKNLDIRCTGNNTSSWGFFFFNKVDDVILDNISIDNCDIGIHIGEAAAGIPARLSVLNSSITNNRGHGFLGGGNNHVIRNNYISDNGSGSVQNHNFYLSGVSDGVEFSGNTVRHSSLDASGVCMGSSVIVHGVHSNLLIENNTISEELGKAALGCWGLTVSPAYTTAEGFTNVTIRGNTVINVGNLGIGVAACRNCLIENNIVSQEQALDFTAIAAPVRSRGAEDISMSDVIIKNNSVYYGTTAKAGTAIVLGSEGNSHQVINNTINYRGSGYFNCFNLDLASSAYSNVDFNSCSYDLTSQGQWELGSGNLSSWQQTGFGLNSQYGVQ